MTRPTRDDRGSVTLWTLGLTLILLAVGGIVFDLWRGLSERRELAATADAAANAAANAIDEPHYRATGELRLDPRRAEAIALDNLQRQNDTTLDTARITTNDTTVTVTLDGTVQLTLLRLLDDRPLAIHVDATAELRRLP